MGLKNAIKRVSVPAPAKINLFLAVTGKRHDGFHELVSVLAKLDLADLVTIDRVSEENHLSCKCVGADQLDGIHNLAEEAVLLWRKRTGIKDGLHLTIEKKIPVEAGLGGGSSDAVATLLALNAMMESPLKQNDLIDLSAQVGSDCPSFLIPGLCVAEGRGERVRSVAAPMNKHMKDKFDAPDDLHVSMHAVYNLMNNRNTSKYLKIFIREITKKNVSKTGEILSTQQFN